MTKLKPVWIEFPNQERRLIKLEVEERVSTALEPHLSGQDLELLRSGALILHTPDGYAIHPNETRGSEIPSGVDCIVMIDPERVVGAGSVPGPA